MWKKEGKKTSGWRETGAHPKKKADQYLLRRQGGSIIELKGKQRKENFSEKEIW